MILHKRRGFVPPGDPCQNLFRLKSGLQGNTLHKNVNVVLLNLLYPGESGPPPFHSFHRRRRGVWNGCGNDEKRVLQKFYRVHYAF